MEEGDLIEVYIKPNAKQNNLIWDKDLQRFVVHVKSPAQKGKANREVILLLKDFFKAEGVILIKGFTSSTKVFELKGVKIHIQELKQAKTK